MAEGTYEYECMRAELLGIEKPEYDEFLKSKKAKEIEAGEVEEEQIDTENLRQAQSDTEGLQGTAGKLEELNSLLSLTQKKINNFKYRCGSVTTFVRTRIGSLSSGGSNNGSNESITNEEDTVKTVEKYDDDEKESLVQQQEQQKPRKSDLSKALDNQVDKLDLILEKAENAHYSMNEQRKQIRRHLK